jgi:phosphoribosylglycinamide formyltransferase 1
MASHHPLILGVMASGSGSNFEAVARSIESGNLNAKIAVLIHNKPGIKAIERARQRGIPTILLDHRAYPTREELDAGNYPSAHRCLPRSSY